MPRSPFIFLPFMRFSVMHNVYCAVCGVILLRQPYVPGGEPTPRRRRPWYSEVRGLTIIDPSDLASLTGVGLVYGQNRLYAPYDFHLSYIESQLQGAWGLSTTSWGPWAFGVHDSCWQILRLRLRHLQESDIVTSVFRQLLCVPCIESSRFDFGHDYEGASQTHKTMAPPLPVDETLLFYADPRTLLAINALDIQRPQSSAFSDCSQTEGCQVFGPLSTELIYEILSYLSCKDVAACRLVNRSIASIGAFENLSQSYWRSRFLLDQEADFIFPNLTERRDWCGLFLAVRNSLKNDKDMSILNRKRIRNLVEPIARVVEEDAALQPDLYGAVVHQDPNQDTPFQLLDSENAVNSRGSLEKCNLLTGYITSTTPSTEPFSYGCRVLHQRAQPLPNPGQRDRGRIAISTRQIGVMTFISGIGMFPSSMNRDPTCILGFHDIRAAKWLEVPPASSIEYIDVAFCPQGMTGIMFSFSNGTTSPWIGIREGPGIAQGSLQAAWESQSRYLLAGLDIYKIVSLGVYGLANDKDSSSGRCSQLRDSHPLAHLWVPSPPNHQGLQISALCPHLEPVPFEPLLNIDFGGADGVYLNQLTGLVCYMGCDPHPLLGLQAVYADGRSVLFGSGRGCEVFFAIAGPDGEWFTDVNVLSQSDDSLHTSGGFRAANTGLCGLQIKTNHGRIANFATIGSRLRNNKQLIRKPESNHIITGLAVRQMTSNDPFIRAALQYQPRADSSMLNQPPFVSPDAAACDAALEYDERFSIYIQNQDAGDCQTYASLKGVRRIQASIGAEGRCRPPSRISGLKLFYDNGPPAVVGQWMDGYKTFDLLPNEDIEYLTVWILPTPNSFEWRPARLGQVVAIRIDTTRHRNIMFTAPGADSLETESLRHQYGHGDGYKLTDIFWIMNSSYDRVRANGCGVFERPSVLVPEQRALQNEVQRLYFDRMEGRGSRDPVVTARACFRERKLLGLEFIYVSGATARVGEVHTAFDVETVEFPDSPRVFGMTVGIKDAHILFIKFELKVLDTSRVRPQYITTDLWLPSSDENGEPRKCDWRHVWCDGEQTLQEGFQPYIREKVYAPPAGMGLVGLSFGCQDFASVGGLYEPVGIEASGSTVVN